LVICDKFVISGDDNDGDGDNEGDDVDDDNL
jgi:hypothetical protein